ncbi:hypothetical protein [Caballeronia sp. J97]|uniref:hypothetical protein n=1 Tax=Caballeronia sp. J97 TaxID=2805429 RepID=UPI002AB1C3D2|nr:hypothetical protein [Caballeronia sp. J97]
MMKQINNGNRLDVKEAETLRDELLYQRTIYAYMTMLPARCFNLGEGSNEKIDEQGECSRHENLFLTYLLLGGESSEVLLEASKYMRLSPGIFPCSKNNTLPNAQFCASEIALRWTGGRTARRCSNVPCEGPTRD